MLKFHLCMLTILALYREGRNEMMIRGPKNVLVSMRKTQSYRETKMRLLQKLNVIEEVMNVSFGSDHHDDQERIWFKGYHVFTSKQEVVKRFLRGEPLSVFTLKGEKNKVHAAFSSGKRFTLQYLTLEYDRTRLHIQETGAHFCQFRLENHTGTDGKSHVSVVNSTNEELMDKVEYHALMLPYSNVLETFQRQYTLVYSDWDVLKCTGPNDKGIPQAEKRVFTDEYINNLSMNI